MANSPIEEFIRIVFTKPENEGDKRTRLFVLSFAIIGTLSAASFFVLEKFEILKIDQSLIALSVSLIFAPVYLVQILSRIKTKEEKEKKIEEYQQRLIENPTETQTAWELARIKLEQYLDRNLGQVRAIFWLTVVVMIFGFSIIAYGVCMVISEKTKIEAAILSTLSGIIVNFIGASILIIYKNTMKQAGEYVKILERINTVGMSMQILENIPAGDKKVEAMLEITKALITTGRRGNCG